MCNILIFGIFWTIVFTRYLIWTLKCKLIYVRLCWRNVVFIISDKFTRSIKLLGDVWESKKRVCLNGNRCIGRRCVLLVLNTLPFKWVRKKVYILRNFVIRYFFWAWNFPGLIFASTFYAHKLMNTLIKDVTLV